MDEFPLSVFFHTLSIYPNFMFYDAFFKNAKFAEFCFEIYVNIFRAQRRETQLMIMMVFKSLKFCFTLSFG